jgi:hypothetical protein
MAPLFVRGTRKTDAFGIIVSKRSSMTGMAERMRGLREKNRGEYNEAIRGTHREMAGFLGTGINKARAVRIALGEDVIKGTNVGDVLEKIKEGKFREVLKERREDVRITLSILEAAGIANRAKGTIDIDAVKGSLKKNRILQKDPKTGEFK